MPSPEWQGAFARLYEKLGYWLALVAASRVLWPGEGEASRRLEAHCYSLVGCFGIWGASAAALGRPVSAVAGALMVAAVVVRVLVCVYACMYVQYVCIWMRVFMYVYA